jgi:hypothetical protein
MTRRNDLDWNTQHALLAAFIGFPIMALPVIIILWLLR